MNTFEKTLFKQYKLLMNLEQKKRHDFLDMPKGSIQKKIIKGNVYYYLQYRDSDKIKSRYIKIEDVPLMELNIAKRNELHSELRNIKKQKKDIEHIISKDDLIIGVIELSVQKVARKHPEITLIKLFGSRADGTYTDASDVDLIFETKGAVSLMKQSEIRLEFEKELGLEVDLIHGPVPDDSFLDIKKEIILYAA